MAYKTLVYTVTLKYIFQLRGLFSRAKSSTECSSSSHFFCNSIRVKWDEPAQPNGFITEYIIYYGTSNVVQSTEQKVTGKTRERVIDGLETFTTYFVKVRGKTSKIGNTSEILNATTFEDSKCITVIASCNNH